MKYIAKPNISIEVVINGPEANAGLNPNLSSIMGVRVPINEEIIRIGIYKGIIILL